MKKELLEKEQEEHYVSVILCPNNLRSKVVYEVLNQLTQHFQGALETQLLLESTAESIYELYKEKSTTTKDIIITTPFVLN